VDDMNEMMSSDEDSRTIGAGIETGAMMNRDREPWYYVISKLRWCLLSCCSES
jgi:hypothetical protein